MNRENENTKSILIKIRKLNQEKGITVAELERRTGIGNGVIRRWDTHSPSADKLQRVAKELNTTVDYLVNGLERNERSRGSQKEIRHKEICSELNQIYSRKNHDYGDSFSETYKTLGIISAITRITDKVNRLQSLCTKDQMVSDESVIDTLKDLANYAIMTVMEMEREQMRDIEARR